MCSRTGSGVLKVVILFAGFVFSFFPPAGFHHSFLLLIFRDLGWEPSFTLLDETGEVYNICFA